MTKKKFNKIIDSVTTGIQFYNLKIQPFIIAL